METTKDDPIETFQPAAPGMVAHFIRDDSTIAPPLPVVGYITTADTHTRGGPYVEYTAAVCGSDGFAVAVTSGMEADELNLIGVYPVGTEPPEQAVARARQKLEAAIARNA